jgi:hypothetical protein
MSSASFSISEFKPLIAAMPTQYHASRARRDKKWKAPLERNDEAGEALRTLFGSEEEFNIPVLIFERSLRKHR